MDQSTDNTKDITSPSRQKSKPRSEPLTPITNYLITHIAREKEGSFYIGEPFSPDEEKREQARELGLISIVGCVTNIEVSEQFTEFTINDSFPLKCKVWVPAADSESLIGAMCKNVEYVNMFF
jgi:hypothetical protein